MPRYACRHVHFGLRSSAPVDKLLGFIIQLPAGAPQRLMNIKRFGKSLCIDKLRIANRRSHLIFDRHAVVIQLKRRIEYFVELEEIADKISLAAY